MLTIELDYFLPTDILKLINAIEENGYNEDDFEIESTNHEKRFIYDLWIKFTPLKFYVHYEYLTAPHEMWVAYYTPAPHGKVQERWVAHKKGPDFHYIESFFISWLKTIKPQVDAVNRFKKKPLKDNVVHNPLVNEIPISEEAEEDRPITDIELANSIQFINLLLPYAESEIGKQITQDQYESLKSELVEIKFILNEPEIKKSVVVSFFGKLAQHEAFKILSPYIKEYILKPIWEGVKGLLPW